MMKSSKENQCSHLKPLTNNKNRFNGKRTLDSLPGIIAGQHHSDSVCHHPLSVVVTHPGVFSRNTKEQICKTKKHVL